VVILSLLHGILEFVGGFISPRTGVSDSPTVFPFSRYFHPLLDLLAPRIDLKFLWCIASFHVLEHSPAISLSILG
jgi:hypothetical protein